jgi:Helix-turn-helix of DDE superfamily endonuclease
MYERLQTIPPKSFKRKCGIRRETFDAMVVELRPHLERKGKRGGQGKFGVEDQLLIALEYWREYRTQFHIGQSWGVHETTVGRIVRKVEEILIRSQDLRLPGKKRLLHPQVQQCVLLMDVTEREIERPQKNSEGSTVASRSATR